jgi:ankyrin repeat protein
MFTVLCGLVIKFRNVSTDPVVNNAPWFQQNLKPNDIEAMINSNPSRIDETYKGTYAGDNNDGLTGLMYEIKAGYPDNARVFIDRGASVDMHAKNGVEMRAGPSLTREESLNERYYKATALHIALMNANDDTAYQLAKDMILGIKRTESNGDVVTVKASVQEKNGYGFTPLHTVVASIETDDYINTTDPTRNRRVEFIKLIMDAAGNKTAQEGLLNAQDDEGNTMLHILADRNAQNTIEWLISTYGRMLKLDLRNKPKNANNVGKNQYSEGMTPAQMADASGAFGGACSRRLDVELERYNNKSISEEDYKNHPKFNDLPIPTPLYNPVTAPSQAEH